MEGALYVLIKRSPGYVFKGQVVEQYFAKWRKGGRKGGKEWTRMKRLTIDRGVTYESITKHPFFAMRKKRQETKRIKW